MLRFIRRHSLLILAVIIFLTAFIARAGALKQYVTPDEPIWVWRALGFAAALARGDWAGTAQIGHPGVTTMWLGTLGILLKRLADPASSIEAIQWLSHITSLSPENAEAFKRLGVFLTFARLPVIFVNALGVVLIFLLARRLFGQRVGLIAGFLLALDPFTASLGGLLHVDGMLTTFAVLSVLALLNGVYRPAPLSSERHEAWGKAWFALAGVFAALAFLSKSPALFLTAFAVLVLIVAVVTKKISFKHALIGFVIFAVCHGVLVVLLYPAMWLDPIGTLNGIIGLASFYSANPVRPTFFDGQYQLNHGIGFYPTALLFRLTPVIMLGLIVALVAGILLLWRKRASLDALGPVSSLQPIVLVLAFAVLYLLFITPVAKKYDRYMLPALAMLIIVAAWGIAQIRSQAVQAIVVIGAAVLMVINWPFLLMSYNLLLGGAAEAQKHFAVGWGEGLGAAANWINRQPDGLQSTAATTAVPSFAPIFSGQSRSTYDRDLELSDYYVITLSERQLLPEFFADLERRGDVVQTLRTGLVDGAWVLHNRQAQLQAAALKQANPRTDAIVTLIDMPVSRAYDGAAQLVVLPREVTSVQIEQILNDLSTRYQRLWITWSPAASAVPQNQIRRWLDQTAELAQQIDFGDTQVAAYDLKPGRLGRIDPFRVQFNGNFALTNLVARPQGRGGSIEARWQALAPPGVAYTVTLQFIDQQGTAWGQGGGPIQDADQFTTDQWPAGHMADQSFEIKLPDEAPPGRYDVRVSIDQADGQRAGLFSAAGVFSGTAPVLTSFDVPPLDAPLHMLARQSEYPFTHRWADQVEILGFDSGPGVVINGDLWPVDVVWRGLSASLPDLTVVWEVDDQNGNKVFSTRLPLSGYPTSQWRQGEIIGMHYNLRFPVDMLPADYHVSIGVAGPDGQPLEGGMFTPFDVRLLHRDRSFDQPQPAHPLDVTFDDPAIKLVGADVPTATLRAGDPLSLTLHWQAGTTTQNLYTVFAHLETLNGQVIAQIDSQPQGGGMPTTAWATGQAITDPYPLTIPADVPPGAYRIVVGMYNPLDGTHLIDTRTGKGGVVLDPPIIVR